MGFKKTGAHVAMRGALVAAVLAAVCIAPGAAMADGQTPVTPTPSEQLSGWQKNKTCYYKDGVKVTGIQKIGHAYYCFNSKGKLKRNTSKVDGLTVYSNSKGVMEAYKKGKTFYKPTGVKMAKYAAKEYQTLLYARKELKGIVKKSDSMSTKMYKCMKWVNKGYYEQYRKFKNKAGWTATFANDHFVKRKNGFRMGDCVSDPCAFAYLCLAAGYKNVAVGVDSAYYDSHGVARINGKYYDPLFCEAKSWSKYYGYHGAYLQAVVKLKVPSYSNGYTTSTYTGVKPGDLNKKENAGDKTDKNGLVKSSGALYWYKNGKKCKSVWVTSKKATYYFGSNGKAVSGSVKVKKNGKKAYYVFDSNCKLLAGSATRVVKLDGVAYRVSAKGKAQGGWTGEGADRRCYLENGALATGPCLVSGKLAVFDAAGAYNQDASIQAQALLVREGLVGNLVELLGAPKKTKGADSCFTLTKTREDGVTVQMEGTDRTYTYDHLKLKTFVADGAEGDGLEYFMSLG